MVISHIYFSTEGGDYHSKGTKAHPAVFWGRLRWFFGLLPGLRRQAAPQLPRGAGGNPEGKKIDCAQILSFDLYTIYTRGKSCSGSLRGGGGAGQRGRFSAPLAEESMPAACSA